MPGRRHRMPCGPRPARPAIVNVGLGRRACAQALASPSRAGRPGAAHPSAGGRRRPLRAEHLAHRGGRRGARNPTVERRRAGASPNARLHLGRERHVARAEQREERALHSPGFEEQPELPGGGRLGDLVGSIEASLSEAIMRSLSTERIARTCPFRNGRGSRSVSSSARSTIVRAFGPCRCCIAHAAKSAKLGVLLVEERIDLGFAQVEHGRFRRTSVPRGARARRTPASLVTSMPRSAGCSRSATIRTSCGSPGTRAGVGLEEGPGQVPGLSGARRRGSSPGPEWSRPPRLGVVPARTGPSLLSRRTIAEALPRPSLDLDDRLLHGREREPTPPQLVEGLVEAQPRRPVPPDSAAAGAMLYRQSLSLIRAVGRPITPPRRGAPPRSSAGSRRRRIEGGRRRSAAQTSRSSCSS